MLAVLMPVMVIPIRGLPLSRSVLPLALVLAPAVALPVTLPLSTSSIKGLAALIGMHMPMPSTVLPLKAEPVYFRVGMPISSPLTLNMPPPLLPLLMAAST